MTKAQTEALTSIAKHQDGSSAWAQYGLPEMNFHHTLRGDGGALVSRGWVVRVDHPAQASRGKGLCITPAGRQALAQ